MKTDHFSTILTMLIYILPASLARGPHHPRGEAIVKRHTHYTPGQEKITQDTELLHDKEHIREHLEEMIPVVDMSKMTDAEIELYYFLLHDTDKNSKLDGLELLHAILHSTEEGGLEHNHESESGEDDTWKYDVEGQEPANEPSFSRLVELVDQVLREDDKNQDGFLDYAEYVEGKKKAERTTDSASSIRLT